MDTLLSLFTQATAPDNVYAGVVTYTLTVRRGWASGAEAAGRLAALATCLGAPPPQGNTSSAELCYGSRLAPYEKNIRCGWAGLRYSG